MLFLSSVKLEFRETRERNRRTEAGLFGEEGGELESVVSPATAGPLSLGLLASVVAGRENSGGAVALLVVVGIGGGGGRSSSGGTSGRFVPLVKGSSGVKVGSCSDSEEAVGAMMRNR